MHAQQSRIALFLVLFLTGATALAGGAHGDVKGKRIAEGLVGTVGATIGPDGALYVAEGPLGQITRVNVSNGSKRPFATGLPTALALPIGGPMDVAFHGRTAYVLISLVDDPFFPPQAPWVDGIYRVEAGGGYTLVADLGAFSVANPPPPGFDYVLVHGLQFSIEAVDDGFLVSDGHLNRVLHVTLAGEVRVLEQFENVAPAGIVEHRNVIYTAEVGPVPHDPSTGRIEAFSWFEPRVVAAGVPLIVDVAVGPLGRLFALSQGTYGGGGAGDPAAPNTGRLLKADRNGTFEVLAEGLNLPTSLSFDGTRAIVVTLTGEVWRYPIPLYRHW